MDIKHGLFNRYAALGFATVLMIGVSDFAQRIQLPSSQEVATQRIQTELAQPQHLPRVSEEQKQQLFAQYEKYDAEARKRGQQTEKGLVSEQQNQPDQAQIDAQQGELLSVLTSSGRIALRGVIKDSGSYALIEKSDHQDKFENIVRLRLGDQMDGFTVIRLDLNSITLTRGSQHITLLMYERQ